MEVDLRQKLDLIHRFSRAIQAVWQMTDMPWLRARLFACPELQCNGKLPEWRQHQFKEFGGGEFAHWKPRSAIATVFVLTRNLTWNPSANRIVATFNSMHYGVVASALRASSWRSGRDIASTFTPHAWEVPAPCALAQARRRA